MKKIASLFTLLVLTGVSAVALEKELVDQLVQSAKNIERDAAMVSLALKSKKVDGEDVTKKIAAMDADLNKLHELVAQLEAGNPSMSDAELATWKMVKEKVQLLEIFHTQKQKLASEDLNKHRSMIRAHADGVAKRAQKLQQSASSLQRRTIS